MNVKWRSKFSLFTFSSVWGSLKLKTINKYRIKGSSQCYASLHCDEYGHLRTGYIYNAGKTLYREWNRVMENTRHATNERNSTLSTSLSEYH